MWYASCMSDTHIEAAEAAVAFARQVRKFHARRSAKGTVQRETDIADALGRLGEAMKPLRSAIGAYPMLPAQGSIAEANRARVRQASAAIQVERRKLWKMRDA
jgi:hypothetical protein